MCLWVPGVRVHEALLHVRAIWEAAQEPLAAVDVHGEGEERGPDDDHDDRACCSPACGGLQEMMDMGRERVVVACVSVCVCGDMERSTSGLTMKLWL